MCKLNSRRKLLLSATLLVAFAAPIIFGQEKATQSQAQSPQTDITTAKVPEFDAVTIKPDKSGIHRRTAREDGYIFTGWTLQQFIELSYDVADNQLIGAPGWVNSETYAIEVKWDSSVGDYLNKLSPDENNLMKKRMFQAVMADRFQLKFHHDTKELPVYVMVIAKNGPKLQEPKPNETLPPGFVGRRGMLVGGRGQLMGQMVPIRKLVLGLSTLLERPIIDKTGLTGSYDFKLQWTPDENSAPLGGQQGNFASPSDAPSFFTAIQEQLGLKLEPQKGPVDVLVIDHVEKPSAN